MTAEQFVHKLNNLDLVALQNRIDAVRFSYQNVMDAMTAANVPPSIRTDIISALRDIELLKQAA